MYWCHPWNSDIFGEPSLQLRRNFNNNTYGTKIEIHKSHLNKNYFKQDNWQKQYFAKNSKKHRTPFEARYQKNKLKRFTSINESFSIIGTIGFPIYLILFFYKFKRTSMKNVIWPVK